MENRDVQFFNQTPFDLHAARSTDVFQIDRAQTWGNQLADLDDVFRILGIHADRERVQPGEAVHQ